MRPMVLRTLWSAALASALFAAPVLASDPATWHRLLAWVIGFVHNDL